MLRPVIRVLVPALFLIAQPAGSACGQATRFGSVYSRFGIGDRILPYSPVAEAMGGGGFALGGTAYASLANPAALADLSLTRALAGFRIQGLQSSDAAGAESRETSGELAGFTFGVPLIAGRFGAAVGLLPYSRSGFRVRIDGTFDPGGVVFSSDEFTTTYEGNGGLDRVSLGLGYRIAPSWAIGLRGDFTFGILEDVQRLRFADARYSEVRLSRATRLRGFSAGAGVRGAFTSLFRDGDALSVGGFVDTPAHLSAERIFSVGSSFEPDTLGSATRGSMDFPLALGAGVAYQSGSRLAVVADVLFEPWSRFDSTLPVAGFDSGGMGDRTRVSTGFEFYPAGRDLLAGLLERTAYRLGAFMERTYVSPDPDRAVRAYGLTGGLSLPTLFPGTRVDINVEAGNRGSAENTLIRDRYLRFGVSVNFADRWFIRRPLN